MNNLTTLAAVKSYLGITVAVQDTLISSLIPRASEQVQRFCGQDFPTKTFSSIKMSGTGSNRLTLPGPPILSVSALQIGSDVITASTDGLTQAGYAFQDFNLFLVGSKFTQGFNNVQVSWIGGYVETEDAYVPTGNTPTLTPSTGGTAGSSIGVTYTANGVSLTQVGNAPVASQFSFSAGVYTFNSADYNNQVTMNYYYVPATVEQAVIETVGLKLKQRTNIGVKSQGLGAESVSYEDKDMSPSVIRMLLPFVRRSYS